MEMTVPLIRYDDARRAFAAAHESMRLKIHDKATALLAYAKQAGDLTLQNQAANIRLLSERRAGQLLLDMNETGAAASQAEWSSSKSLVNYEIPTTLPKLELRMTSPRNGNGWRG